MTLKTDAKAKLKVKKGSGFILFDHTADIGADLYGKSANDIFEQAAMSMYSIIFHDKPPKVNKIGEYEIKLSASDLEQLLVDWLDELLYIYTTENIIMSHYNLNIDLKKNTLDANVMGAIIPEEQLKATCEIKAITYHMLSITKVNDHWEGKVLFDI